MSRFIILLSSLLFISSCSLSPDNEQAKLSMKPNQLAFLQQNVSSITPDMDEETVSSILGEAYRGEGTSRPVWLGPNKDKTSQIAIYYSNGKIFKIRWMELGNFLWEKNWEISK